MRLAVYTDYIYRREDGRVYGERAFVLFLTALADHVDELTVVGRLDPRPGTWHYPLPESTRFVALPYYESLTRPHQAIGSMFRSLGRFWRVLGHVDAVWLMGPYVHSLAFAPLAVLRRRRTTLGVRQDLPALARLRSRRRSLHLAADVLESTWRLYARRLPIVTVGPDLARNYGHARKVLPVVVSLVSERDLGAPGRDWDGPRRILSVGRLEPEKNPLLLVDVLARLQEAGGDWHLVVCGDGPLKPDVETRAVELGVADRVELRGYVPLREGLLDVYRTAHVFLHVAWSEGLPQVLFEAFATGLPTVATAVGGVPEAVGDAALLVPPGDVEAAAVAVERLAGDAERRRRLVAAGLRLAREHTLEAETARVAAFVLGGIDAGTMGSVGDEGTTSSSAADKIENKQFGVARRGFDRDEVRSFLRAVAAEHRKVVTALAEAVAEAEAQREQASKSWIARSPIADIGRHVESVLTAAAEAALQMQAEAERELVALRVELEHLLAARDQIVHEKVADPSPNGVASADQQAEPTPGDP
ncbi:MAG: hypothetical protein QOG43_2743 [Actinomycetota bacterium]|nr:hypothetical protein [Actinomycetota bacterium]